MNAPFRGIVTGVAATLLHETADFQNRNYIQKSLITDKTEPFHRSSLDATATTALSLLSMEDVSKP
jgi:hypothetical protein